MFIRACWPIVALKTSAPTSSPPPLRVSDRRPQPSASDLSPQPPTSALSLLSSSDLSPQPPLLLRPTAALSLLSCRRRPQPPLLLRPLPSVSISTQDPRTKEMAKRIRINWKQEGVEKTFLEACVHEITVNGREGSSLKQASWKTVAENLKTQHNFIVEQRQMKNHYDFLKGKFAAWLKLKNKTVHMVF
uniref:Putative myb/SANT-like domain-containing protein n=1 Tax=Helianthus annuus TaxID=4232 RepID=A0A251U3B1_HELAN